MIDFILEHKDLIVYISIGLIVLIFLFVILGIVAFKPAKCKRMLRGLDKKYQYFHSLLIGQDSQYVKRLEIISRTNLLYVDTHTNFSRKFKDIRDRYDANALNAYNQLKDFLDDKEYKKFKEFFKEATATISEFDEAVTNFNKEIIHVIKPEEDCRQSALEYKTRLKAIKQEYYSKENGLSLVVESFEDLFKLIDEKFSEFENCIESAQYEEANKILPDISDILDGLSFGLSVLPELCALIEKIVPNKIHEVETAYKLLSEEHYPLVNLFVLQTIGSMKDGLSVCTSKIQRFETEGVKESLNNMLEKLDEIFVKFDKEKEAKLIFDEKYETVYLSETNLQDRFITLKNTIPEVSKYFVINKDHNDKLATLQNDVNRLDSLKRSLDTLIHASTKQPYSVLVNRLIEIENISASIKNGLDEFDQYLANLNSDASKAYDAVFSTYEKTKVAEELLRQMNLASMKEKYQESINSMYDLLNEINVLNTTAPIDIDKVNEKIHELTDLSNKLLDDGEIKQDYNLMVLAEKAIVIGNKDRFHLADIDQLLSQAEAFFESGDFEKANETAKTALSKIKQTKTNGK